MQSSQLQNRLDNVDNHPLRSPRPPPSRFLILQVRQAMLNRPLEGFVAFMSTQNYVEPDLQSNLGRTDRTGGEDDDFKKDDVDDDCGDEDEEDDDDDDDEEDE